MTAQQAQRLTDAELSERTTWPRQQIEAIRPYYSHELSRDYRTLTDEATRRLAPSTATPAATEGSV